MVVKQKIFSTLKAEFMFINVIDLQIKTLYIVLDDLNVNTGWSYKQAETPRIYWCELKYLIISAENASNTHPYISQRWKMRHTRAYWHP